MSIKHEPFKLEPHKFSDSVKILNYSYCMHCGLIALKNDFTQWALKNGCNHKDHPSYEYKRKQYTKLFD